MELVDECINKIPALVACNLKSNTDVIICNVRFPRFRETCCSKDREEKEKEEEKSSLLTCSI